MAGVIVLFSGSWTGSMLFKNKLEVTMAVYYSDTSTKSGRLKSRTVPICRWYDCLYKVVQQFYKNILSNKTTTLENYLDKRNQLLTCMLAM